MVGWQLWPRPGEWRSLIILSAIFTLQISTMNYGYKFTSGIMGSILLATHPLWAGLFSVWLIPSDRLNVKQALGMIVAFFGATLVLSQSTNFTDLHLSDLGNAIVLISASLLGLRLSFAGRLVKSIDPVRVTIWMMALSIPIFAVAGITTETIIWERLWWQPLVALLYQGVIIAGLGFLINYLLMRRYNPSVVVSFGFFAPISGVLSSAWILDEILTWSVAGGATIVGIGLILITKRK